MLGAETRPEVQENASGRSKITVKMPIFSRLRRALAQGSPGIAFQRQPSRQRDIWITINLAKINLAFNFPTVSGKGQNPARDSLSPHPAALPCMGSDPVSHEKNKNLKSRNIDFQRILVI